MDQPQKPPLPPAPAYLYTERYLGFDYGPYHPLQISRLALTHELINVCGLGLPPHPVREANLTELADYHDLPYLEALRQVSENPVRAANPSHGLGNGDNPVFPGVFKWSALLTGASLQAADLVSLAGHPIAFNLAGGMHHALAGKASGFCYLNDVVLAIRRLTAQGFRVAYVDLDAHHGDGVQWAFYESPQVLTISLHQHPATLFPGTGRVEEMGREEGWGFCINVPLLPGTDDEIYVRCFEQVVPPALQAFAPDFLVTQLGVDSFRSDPLANLELSMHGFFRCLKVLKQAVQGGWIALGGGGYNVVNVARAWTVAWALMQGREADIPSEMPADFCARNNILADERLFWDRAMHIRGRSWDRAAEEAKEVVARIKKNVFPVLQARP